MQCQIRSTKLMGNCHNTRMKLQSKCALVSGGTRGIGLKIAERLLTEGAHVSISAREQERLSRTVEELSPLGPISGTVCDVRKPLEVKDWIQSANRELGAIDILINNAGVGIFRPVAEMTVAEWNSVIQTNLDSLFYACHYALPHLVKCESGFIINIGSLAGKNAFPGGAAYNASKFGLIGFSEALMQETRYQGIRVAYIMPGSVDTWFGGGAPVGEKSWKIAAEDVAQVVVETLQRPARCLSSRIELRPSQPPRK